MGTITLTTDFGLKDHYVGAMKGAILSTNPAATIVDITHEVEPQDIREAAFLIDEYYRYFPPGTVHVVIVDPMVGSARRPVIVSRDSYYFVGPDNGTFTIVASGNVQVHIIENPSLMLSAISPTFHGRDIFAPTAARLALGFYPKAFGRQTTNPILLTGLHPVQDGNELHGEVVRFDRFGNAVTNIRSVEFETFVGNRPYEISIGSLLFSNLNRSYYEGEHTCLVGSAGYIEFGFFQGSFKETRGGRKGDTVTIRIR